MSYKIQIDDVVREATAEEIEEIEARIAAKAVEEQRKADAEAKRQEILDRLGLTSEEAKLLLG